MAGFTPIWHCDRRWVLWISSPNLQLERPSHCASGTSPNHGKLPKIEKGTIDSEDWIMKVEPGKILPWF
ncbi:hypothetical protein RSAG8_10432, partial [Rhizoctonia solani AG-8 WAC10335]